jgi:hypothetical protein
LQVADVEGRVLVPNLESLMAHMIAVIENLQVGARARVAGPAHVRDHFTWKHVVDRLVEVMF